MAKSDRQKQLDKEWFIDSLLRIKSTHKHTQQEIAETVGVTQPMISRIKSGASPVPDEIIKKMVEAYSLPAPKTSTSKEDYPPIVNESQSDYYQQIKVRYELLERNMYDIRRELETTYNYIATLQEFNSYLKADATK